MKKDKFFYFIKVVLVILIVSFILFLLVSNKQLVDFLRDQLIFLDNVIGGR